MTTDRLDDKALGTPSSYKSEELEKLESAKGDETIYITNNLPYICKLEYGSSKQAPNGMVGLTMNNISNNIDKFIKESEQGNI